MRALPLRLAAGSAILVTGAALWTATGAADPDPDVVTVEPVGAPRAAPAVIAPPSSAPPPTTTTVAPPPPAPAWDPADRGQGWEQRLGAAAVALIDFDPAAVGYRIEFLPARPGLLGTTYPAERLIRVWVRPGMTPLDVAEVVAHELGHAVDVEWNTAGRRLHYRAVRGLHGQAWFTCDGCADFDTPAGDFAEVFAWHVLGGAGRFRSRLGPPPTPEQLAALVPLFHP